MLLGVDRNPWAVYLPGLSHRGGHQMTWTTFRDANNRPVYVRGEWRVSAPLRKNKTIQWTVARRSNGTWVTLRRVTAAGKTHLRFWYTAAGAREAAEQMAAESTPTCRECGAPLESKVSLHEIATPEQLERAIASTIPAPPEEP